MKEEKTKGKKRILYYFILTVSVLLLAAAIVLTVYFVSGQGGESLETPPPDDTQQPNNPDDNKPDKPNKPDDQDPNNPAGSVDKDPYVSPVANASYKMEYADIYKNETVGWYYRHYAVDFTADAGAEVKSMAEGTVTQVSKSKETGNIIVVDHADGLQSVYRFVEPIEGLGVGQKVSKGEKIGTVAEAYGVEKADGPHLHFELKSNGKWINPTSIIKAVLEEK